MSTESPSPLSDAQAEIMEIIWENGEVAVSEVWDILHQRRGVARNTVQTMLVRMEEKGWLKHRTIGRTFFYSAARPKRETRTQAVQQLLLSLFGGSAEDLATALLEQVKLSEDEADRIRALIDKAERSQRKRKKES